MRKVLAACALAVALLAAGCGSTRAGVKPAAVLSPATFTLVGTFTLAASAGVLNIDDVNCTGMNGYDDIQTGASVTVSDASGTTVALGQLSSGKLVGSGFTRTCVYELTVSGVPAGKGFYGVEIAHRGVVKMSESAMHSPVSLSLGG